jgi:hypothetical protein
MEFNPLDLQQRNRNQLDLDSLKVMGDNGDEVGTRAQVCLDTLLDNQTRVIGQKQKVE